MLDTVWEPQQGSAVRVLKHPLQLDHHGAPGVWMVLDHHPDEGRWWLVPYDEASRIWAEAHPAAAKGMNRPEKLLLPAVLPLPANVS